MLDGLNKSRSTLGIDKIEQLKVFETHLGFVLKKQSFLDMQVHNTRCSLREKSLHKNKYNRM